MECGHSVKAEKNKGTWELKHRYWQIYGTKEVRQTAVKISYNKETFLKPYYTL